MVDFAKGFKRPFSDLKKFIIGVVIMMIPIVNIVGYGYVLKCAENTLKKRGKSRYALPKWKEWGDLFVKGLIGIIITIIFFLPALVFFFLGLGATNVFGMVYGGVGTLSTTFTGLGITYMLITLILVLAAALLQPLALMTYVKKWKFSEAFKLKLYTKKINVNYIIVWVVSIIYAGVLSMLLSPLLWIGSGIAFFITMVTTYGTWYAEVYKGK